MKSLLSKLINITIFISLLFFFLYYKAGRKRGVPEEESALGRGVN